MPQWPLQYREWWWASQHEIYADGIPVEEMLGTLFWCFWGCKELLLTPLSPALTLIWQGICLYVFLPDSTGCGREAKTTCVFNWQREKNYINIDHCFIFCCLFCFLVLSQIFKTNYGRLHLPLDYKGFGCQLPYGLCSIIFLFSFPNSS